MKLQIWGILNLDYYFQILAISTIITILGTEPNFYFVSIGAYFAPGERNNCYENCNQTTEKQV